MIITCKEKELASLNKALVKAAEDEMWITENNQNVTNSDTQSLMELEQLKEEHKFELLTQA